MTTQTAKKKSRLYRGLTPQQLAQERRDRLLATALELFGEKGYANAPIELLCATAKVATRHFYEQFNSRESLLKAVFDQITSNMQAHIAEQLAADTRDLPLRASDAIYVCINYLLEDARRARIYCIETVGVSTEMEKHRRQSIHDLAKLVENYAAFLVDSGDLPARDYHLPSVAVAGMINELMVEWLVNDTGLSSGEVAREGVILLRAMMSGARNYQPGGAQAEPLNAQIRDITP